MFTVLAISSLILWLIILLLPWRPWGTREHFDPQGCQTIRGDLSMVTVLVPARNEAETIGNCLRSLLDQCPSPPRIIVIDDCSSDGTRTVARSILGNKGRVIVGEGLPEGWSGKLWALDQGLRHVTTPYVLLMDADIRIDRDTISQTLSFMEEKSLDFFSLMAELNMQGWLERLFMPAFIYFFKLLYPFALSNDPTSSVAAAAGGFILTRVELLKKAGAFNSFRDALIDDCTLAGKVKGVGAKTYIGLTHKVKSIRRYNRFRSIWEMVSRTAYCQLGYNPAMLLVATLLMTVAFVVPPMGILTFPSWAALCCLLSLLIMSISYVPVLRYYGLHPILSIALPFVASLYMAMTWSSALAYYAGKGATWKGRFYH